MVPFVPIISRRRVTLTNPPAVRPEDLARIPLMHPTKGRAVADKFSVADYERQGFKRVQPASSGAKRKG